MDRQLINKRAIQLAQDNNLVALEWATGVGKSKAALDIIASLHTQEPQFSVLLVVAEIAHIKNWQDEADKWGYNSMYNEHVFVTTYASLKHQISKFFDIIILDEAHHVGSDLRLDFIQKIGFDKMVLLSATFGQELLPTLKVLLKQSIEQYTITLKIAIDWDILPDPLIYLIPLQLDNRTNSEIITEEWGVQKKRKVIKCLFEDRWTYMAKRKVYTDVTLIITCTPMQKYLFISDKIEYLKKMTFRTNNQGVRNKWLQMGSQRKLFLGNSKTEVARELLESINDKRFICFCSSIEQADELGGDNAIHSKKDDPALTIERFNNGDINNLFAVGMIKEGQNLTDIEVGVIIQLDGAERQFIQKFGRSLRAKDPIQYIFYYENTRDQEYLDKILEEVDIKYVQTMEL